MFLKRAPVFRLHAINVRLIEQQRSADAEIVEARHPTPVRVAPSSRCEFSKATPQLLRNMQRHQRAAEARTSHARFPGAKHAASNGAFERRIKCSRQSSAARTRVPRDTSSASP
jgi:hypothetical protein